MDDDISILDLLQRDSPRPKEEHIEEIENESENFENSVNFENSPAESEDLLTSPIIQNTESRPLQSTPSGQNALIDGKINGLIALKWYDNPQEAPKTSEKTNTVTKSTIPSLPSAPCFSPPHQPSSIVSIQNLYRIKKNLPNFFLSEIIIMIHICMRMRVFKIGIRI